MARGYGRVVNTALGFASCCITPRDHNPNTIRHVHVKHELTNIRRFIVAPWLTSSCALTSDSVC